MSRRNNIKILGLPESKEEKTWDDTENLVKQTIKNTLKIQDEVQIERAHRVGKPRPLSRKGKDGTKVKNDPRSIVAKLTSWKQKEAILKAARKIQPKGVKLYQDLSSRTLERRAELIPDLLRIRKQGKITFLVLDKLVVLDKDKDNPDENVDDNNSQVSEND